jgi:DNA-binding NarL/FixJ family response regulator
MNKTKILIADDEQFFVYSLKKLLQNFGYEITGTATDYQEIIDNIESAKPDLIIMKIGLKGEKGNIDTVIEALSVNKIPVIFLSSNINPEIIKKTKEIEYVSFMAKPANNQFINLLQREITDLLGRLAKSPPDKI